LLSTTHTPIRCSSSLLPSSSRSRPLPSLCPTPTLSSASADAPGSPTTPDAHLTGLTVARTAPVQRASAASLLPADENSDY
ncbi:hypothetical protein CYLTODRAFT_488438, partial [Cylindrobasidium torrendii FP15055 ss-10]